MNSTQRGKVVNNELLPERTLQNPCPICGDLPLDSEPTKQLVSLMHNLQLAEVGLLVTGGQQAALYGEDYAGRGFLVGVEARLRVDLSNAVNRLLKAFRQHLLPGHDPDDPTVVLIAPRSVVRSQLEAILGHTDGNRRG